MSSIGLGKPPVIYPTPLDNDRGSSGAAASGFSPSPSLNKSFSSPLIPKYNKRRVKKLGNKSVMAPKGASKMSFVNNGKDSASDNDVHGGRKDLNLDDNGVDPIKKMYVKDTEEYKLHLIRKIFLPKVSITSDIKDYLPALTSSGSVDIELYCFIGLLFKNFINEWYFKITENDEFISEVVDVMAHITRELETRVRKVRLEDFIFDHAPYILDNHQQFYNYCLDNLDSQYVQETTMNEAFDALNSHPALSMRFRQYHHSKGDGLNHRSSDDDINQNFTFNDSFYNETLREPRSDLEEVSRLEENYLGIISKGALALLLPVDVSDSDLARYFVRSVMANIVLRILTKQLSEPDIIYSILLGIFRSLNKDSDKSAEGQKHTKKEEIGEIPQTLKGKIVSVFRKVSHFIAYSTSTGSNQKQKLTRPPIAHRYIFQFLNNLFSFSTENPVLYVFMKYFALWFLSYNIEEIRHAEKMKTETIKTRSESSSSSASGNAEAASGVKGNSILPKSISAIVNANLFALKINQIIYNLFGKLVLQKFFQNAEFLASLVKTARHTIFPGDDKMGPPRKIPNDEEIEEMKIELFKLMKKKLPFWFKLLIFNEVGEAPINSESVFEDDEDMNNVFNDRKDKFKALVKTKTDYKFYRFIQSFQYQKFNKLMVYNLMDHFFLELFPEMRDLTPSVLERHD
ncbi:hypothetical protein DASC09_040050 [Saccharomycopsis crataegensis]|uniref:PXA domain-containing protein n=1 Tax=Saccharomycopsis crataegensis TaxID=43959 RepID=A0AAV5QQY0_9ASCO|nr:hypothetical protein DASC09_040050 [Saccharomycopsis crataegensis]